MLIDPSFRKIPSELISILNSISSRYGNSGCAKIRTGVYHIGHWNFDSLINDVMSTHPQLMPYEEVPWYDCYGVCDSPDQFMETVGAKLEADKERKYCVSLVRLLKSEQETPGGWRWHKWGPYIGKQDPQCEYLYDEPVITEVWTYHVYEMA